MSDLVIDARPRFEVYTATEGQTDFNIPFEYDAAAHVRVRHIALSDGAVTNYTTSSGPLSVLPASGESGVATLPVASAAGDTVIVYGETTLTRAVQYSQSVKPGSLNLDGNRLIMLIQELARDRDRALKLDLGEADLPIGLKRSHFMGGSPYYDEAASLWKSLPSDAVSAVQGALASIALVATAISGGTISDLLDGQVGGVLDKASLKSAAGLNVGTIRAMASRTTIGDGGAGLFVWDDQDLSSQVAADPGEGFFVAPTGEDGSNGAHRRVLADAINAKYFGLSESADGATNRTALQNAANFATSQNKMVSADAGDYDITGTVTFAPTGNNVATVGIIGEGSASTIFHQQDLNADTFVCAHSDNTKQFILRPHFQCIQIKYQNTLDASTGAAIRHRQSINGTFIHVVIESAPHGIVSERGVQCWYDMVYYRTNLVTASNKARAAFTFDHDPDLAAGTSFGNFMSNCEVQTGKGVEKTLHLLAVDGLYINNCHFDYAATHIYISPDNTGGRTTVRHVRVSNSYFDVNAAVTLNYAVFVSATGSGSADIFGLGFSNCVLRGSTGNAFRVAGDVAGMAGLGSLKQIQFIGNEFRGWTGAVINFAMDASYDETNFVEDITVGGNIFDNTSGSAVSNAILVRGKNWNIGGNTYNGNWTDAGSSVISVGATTDKCLIAGEIFDVARAAPININASAVDVLSYGHIGEGVTDIAQIVSEGTNADGYWIRYKNGQQEVRKTISLVSQDISTAWGSLFISSNLMAGQTAMAQSFDAVPNFQITARTHDALAMTGVAGAGTVSAWPSIVQLVRGTSATGKDVEIDCVAKGTWS